MCEYLTLCEYSRALHGNKSAQSCLQAQCAVYGPFLAALDDESRGERPVQPDAQASEALRPSYPGLAVARSTVTWY
jgi:hypothetical protein